MLNSFGISNCNNFLNETGGYSTPSGGGDMNKSTYDPQNINGDAFDRSNHTGTQSISSVTNLQTELNSKIESDNYAVFDTGGTLKARLDGTDLYLTNDGSDA